MLLLRARVVNIPLEGMLYKPDGPPPERMEAQAVTRAGTNSIQPLPTWSSWVTRSGRTGRVYDGLPLLPRSLTLPRSAAAPIMFCPSHDRANSASQVLRAVLALRADGKIIDGGSRSCSAL